MKLNDWEFEDWLKGNRPDLETKVWNGEMSYREARKITGIKERLE